MHRSIVRVAACVLTFACGGGSSTGPSTPVNDGKIGAEGGTVVSSNGLATLTIPAGALSARFAVTLVPATTKPVDARLLTSSAFVISPAMTFSAAASLKLTYDPAERPAGSLESSISAAQVSGNTWSPVAASAVALNSTQHTVTVSVTASGTYAAHWRAPTTACAGTEERQFDFWAGTWNFSAPNAFPGTETVTIDASGCALYEVFTQGQYSGHSVSFYNRADSKWYQTYVDSDKQRLVLSGTFVSGSMLLYSNPNERYGWMRLDAQRIRYYGEQSANAGVTWQSLFEALYSK
jgi:hypothetical protein